MMDNLLNDHSFDPLFVHSLSNKQVAVIKNEPMIVRSFDFDPSFDHWFLNRRLKS
jgi:hypothetical protein